MKARAEHAHAEVFRRISTPRKPPGRATMRPTNRKGTTPTSRLLCMKPSRMRQHALAHAADEQQQAHVDLARAQNDLRNLPNDEPPSQADADAHAKGRCSPRSKHTGWRKHYLEANAQSEAGQHQEHQASKRRIHSRLPRQRRKPMQEAQQDASQQNPQAAQQAAEARAVQAMARNSRYSPGSTDNNPGNEPGQAPATMSGRTTDSREGTALIPVDASVPGPVLDIGITADQWAVLPPLEKKDLMNAAQQSGPPGYRQMTKDYFAKIARIQSDGK